MTTSPHYGNGQCPITGRKRPVSSHHQSPKSGHPYLPLPPAQHGPASSGASARRHRHRRVRSRHSDCSAGRNLVVAWPSHKPTDQHAPNAERHIDGQPFHDPAVIRRIRLIVALKRTLPIVVFVPSAPRHFKYSTINPHEYRRVDGDESSQGGGPELWPFGGDRRGEARARYDRIGDLKNECKS